MEKTKRSDFKATYLRVLSGHGLPAQGDWWAAGELIDQGHATGLLQRSLARADHGAVENLLSFAPTVSGRLLADDLAQQLHRQSWRYRAVHALVGLGSFASGWLLGVSTELGKAWAVKLLGM